MCFFPAHAFLHSSLLFHSFSFSPSWEYFPHDHARSRAYRWGEDGLLGITDRECRLCFALSLWNGKDPILKERLFGLTGPEGNHGEDCKELYYYLDSTPTHSYMKGLYKYPQVCLCVYVRACTRVWGCWARIHVHSCTDVWGCPVVIRTYVGCPVFVHVCGGVQWWCVCVWV